MSPVLGVCRCVHEGTSLSVLTYTYATYTYATYTYATYTYATSRRRTRPIEPVELGLMPVGSAPCSSGVSGQWVLAGVSHCGSKIVRSFVHDLSSEHTMALRVLQMRN